MRLATAIAAGVAVVLSAPFMGEARRWIRLEFPGQFVAIVGGAVALAATTAVVWALASIRAHRRPRYALVAAAVTLAVVYARWSALGNPDSDVVERVHFVEYGLITWLFYRAWSPLGSTPTLVLTFISATTVGTFEEWLQWLIPARVGEVRDIVLNSAAIVSGLLFSVALRPLGGLPTAGHGLEPRRGRSLRAVATTMTLATAALAGFVGSAHLGHEIRDESVGTFRSIYSGDQLRTLAVERQREWTAAPPLTRPARLSVEDQYASEGLLHVQERNLRWTAGDIGASWHENLILEGYFAPVLDTPSYVSSTGHRWPAEQRLDAERRMAASGVRAPFVSRAQGTFPILVWPAALFWAVSVVLVATWLAIALRASGRSAAGVE